MFVAASQLGLLDALAASGFSPPPVCIAFGPAPRSAVLKALQDEEEGEEQEEAGEAEGQGRPRARDPAMWRNVVRHAELAVGAMTGYDPAEISYVAHAVYDAYAAPALAGTGAVIGSYAMHARLAALTSCHPALCLFIPVQKTDDNKLRREAEPAFAAARAGVFEHDIHIAPSRATPRGVDLELPFYPKLLIISAFCASHNPPETDTRYFSREGSGRVKKARKTPFNGDANVGAAASSLPTSRAFTFERWTALFEALLAGNDVEVQPEGAGVSRSHLSAVRKLSYRNLQGQITQLLLLRFIERVSHASELDVIKFRCLASLPAVTAIACTVHIDLGKYLHLPVA